MNYYTKLSLKIENKKARVGVIGLGYVGLPLALEVSKAGYQTIGIDINTIKVESINLGESYIKDVASKELGFSVNEGKLKATTNFQEIMDLDIVSICVPTPLSNDYQPDMTYIINAVDKIEKYFHKGILIILESTTYPGTTEDLIEKRLAAKGYQVGEDYFLCFSPERIDPGNQKFNTKTTPKVIGGATSNCLELGLKIYSQFIDRLVKVSSPKAAEMTKLLENTFRSVNIAFINEMAILSEKLNINIWEVIEAAKTKPFGFMPFYPGPGIGGHCIPLDPMYLQWTAKNNDASSRFIELAQETNKYMPIYTIGKIMEILNEDSKAIKNSNILILGMSYKTDTDDYRESPNVTIYKKLKEKGAHVDYYDNNVPVIEINGGLLESLESLESLELISEYDCIVILTNHSHINYKKLLDFNIPIFDTRNALKIDHHLVYKIGK